MVVLVLENMWLIAVDPYGINAVETFNGRFDEEYDRLGCLV